MNIRRMSFISALVILSATFHINQAVAQDDRDAVLNEIEQARSIGQEQWKQLVALNLTLSEQEAGGFWPVYDEYRSAMAKVNDRLLTLITDYADSFNSNSLTDKEAKRLVEEYLSIQEQEVKTKKKYLKKFQKVLPAKKVMLFYQIDNKMMSMIKAGIALEVPLVSEVD